MFPDLRNNLKSSGSWLYECSISYSTLKTSIASRIQTPTGELRYLMKGRSKITREISAGFRLCTGERWLRGALLPRLLYYAHWLNQNESRQILRNWRHSNRGNREDWGRRHARASRENQASFRPIPCLWHTWGLPCPGPPRTSHPSCTSITNTTHIWDLQKRAVAQHSH